MPDPLPPPLPYIRAFDGLRALAVLLVLFHHWPFPAITLPFGWVGVNIFFVLSGFLITRILVHTRKRSLKEYLSRFYRNRLLRIFPLYYAYLAGITLLLVTLHFGLQNPPAVISQGLAAAGIELPSLLTYTYNFQDLWHLWDGKDNSHDVRFFSHLWSLSVEEQYYLVFPFLIYFLPEKNLKYVLVAIVLLSPALRLLTGELLRDTQNGYFTGMLLCRLPFFQLDAFAIGGLIALTNLNRLENPGKWLAVYGFGVAGIGLVSVYFLRQNGIEISWKSLGFESPFYQYQQNSGNPIIDLRYFITFTLVNLAAALLLLTALRDNQLSRLFQTRWATFAGRVSYGLYIFHFPLLVFLLVFLEFAGLLEVMKQNVLLEAIGFLCCAGLTLLLSAFSYRFFESRFLRLKR